MRKKYKKQKVPVLLVGFIAIGIIAVGLKFSSENGWLDTFTALGGKETHKDGDTYISPSSQEVDQAETATFMSYTQESTDAVPITGDWSVTPAKKAASLFPLAYASLPEESQTWLDAQSSIINKLFISDSTTAPDKSTIGVTPITAKPIPVDTEPPSSIILKDCQASSSCQITVGNQPGEYDVTEKVGSKNLTAKLKVKDKFKPSPFKDNVPDWAAEAAFMLQSNDIMRGYTSGDFAAEDPVSRAQLTVLLYRTMTQYKLIDADTAMNGKDCNRYTDVPPDHFAYQAICFGSYYHWFDVTGVVGKLFKPADGLTRREVAQIMYNAIGKSLIHDSHSPYTHVTVDQLKTIATVFKDMTKTDKSAEAAGALYLLAVMTGTTTDTNVTYLYPDKTVNRGETAALLWRTLQKIDKYIVTPKNEENKPTI